MKTLVVAPHPDDEVLGVGGTLFRRKKEGRITGWLTMTAMSTEAGYSLDQVEKRKDEVNQISKIFAFDSVFELGFTPTKLDLVPMNKLVEEISKVIAEFAPTEVFIPHHSDIHSDHRITFEAVASCIKWFRSPSVKRILAYETLSETNMSLVSNQRFNPNIFINIEEFLENKLRAMSIYSSEVEKFPFPRSSEAIVALASFRGASSGFKAAEAFELLREIS
jgi:LmbE family N-acetylglucosaminyl deacetylase